MAPTVVHCRTMRHTPSMPCLAAPVPAAAVAAAATAACSQDGTKRMQRGRAALAAARPSLCFCNHFGVCLSFLLSL